MVILIVPCYNEEKRLPIKDFIQNSNKDLQILFADDGSTDRTKNIIQDAQKQNSYLHYYGSHQNLGKGEVIRAAYSYLKNQSLFSEVTWIGYWDADLATPLYEVGNMLGYAISYKDVVTSIWGSRVYRLGSRIVRSHLRHYFGRGFATLIAIYLGIESYDSQCGAKLFHKSISDKVFEKPFISKWIFDVEILLRLEQKGIIEYPLRSWEDVPGSKVKIFKEIFRVLWDIFKIKKQYLKH